MLPDKRIMCAAAAAAQARGGWRYQDGIAFNPDNPLGRQHSSLVLGSESRLIATRLMDYPG